MLSGIQPQNDRLVTMIIEKNNFASNLEDENDDLKLQIS